DAIGRPITSLLPPTLARQVRRDPPPAGRSLERAMILSRGGPIEVEHLAPELRDPRRGEASDKLEDVERAHILRVLEAAQGNRTPAAELLGIGRSTLKRKLAEYGVADDE